MGFCHEMAVEQLEGIKAAVFPECESPDDDDAMAAHEGRIAIQVIKAAQVGQFMALLAISETLQEFVDQFGIPPAAASLGLHVTGISGKEIPMPPITPITLDTNHNLSLAITPKDAAGNPVAEATPPSWSSSATAVLALTAAADGLSCLAVTVAAGTATVSVTDGVNTDSQDVTVTAGGAVSLGLSSSIIAK